jgi:hypothetical protein
VDSSLHVKSLRTAILFLKLIPCPRFHVTSMLRRWAQTGAAAPSGVWERPFRLITRGGEAKQLACRRNVGASVVMGC